MSFLSYGIKTQYFRARCAILITPLHSVLWKVLLQTQVGACRINIRPWLGCGGSSGFVTSSSLLLICSSFVASESMSSGNFDLRVFMLVATILNLLYETHFRGWSIAAFPIYTAAGRSYGQVLPSVVTHGTVHLESAHIKRASWLSGNEICLCLLAYF